jgi:hypothetical protein
MGGGVAAEVEGAIWVYGRHNRAKGYQADIEKYNCAAVNGWMVLRFTPEMVQGGTAIAALKQALNREIRCAK